MPLIEPIIRPPAEADSFLLQVTTGCSSNNCTFCGAYQQKHFNVMNYQDILNDIQYESRINPEIRKVFLLDGDALALNNEKILPVLEQLNFFFPKLVRVASYANGYNITQRSDNDLKELYQNKLKLVYMGLESGSQIILDKCQKKSRVTEMILAVQRLKQAGIKSSVIVLLGLGGKINSKLHVQETINALNLMQPDLLSFLTLMLVPGTTLFQQAKSGEFAELNASQMLQETYDIIKGLDLKRTIFRSNHASNFLGLKGRFPHDKQILLNELQEALAGKRSFVPNFMRGL